MSASPIARQLCASHAQSIPSKKVLIHDPNQMPDVYSSTPNGTLYSTTPGGKFHQKTKKNTFYNSKHISFSNHLHFYTIGLSIANKKEKL